MLYVATCRVTAPQKAHSHEIRSVDRSHLSSCSALCVLRSPECRSILTKAVGFSVVFSSIKAPPVRNTVQLCTVQSCGYVNVWFWPYWQHNFHWYYTIVARSRKHIVRFSLEQGGKTKPDDNGCAGSKGRCLTHVCRYVGSATNWDLPALIGADAYIIIKLNVWIRSGGRCGVFKHNFWVGEVPLSY